MLTPTPSVRPADGHSPQQDAEGKARRRPQPAPENPDEGELSDGTDTAPHQLDHLA
ncbi:MAG TPA: hypothetical protein VEH47_04905 [Candidatus Acidoferrales bacterium]|nr:hypothetical protein [Candidatus Acidoferrales bacterium]